MTLEDQQLDERLRSVRVPSDLRTRLQAQLNEQAADDEDLRPSIATNIEQDQPKPISMVRPNRRRTWWVITTAASLFVIVSGAVVWKLDLAELAFGTKSVPIVSAGAGSTNPVDADLDRSIIEKLDRQLAAMQSELRSRELRQIERRIALAERELNSLQAQSGLGDPSFTLAAVAETALKAGASPMVVKEDLEFVIDRFPNSDGAKLATTILSKLN